MKKVLLATAVAAMAFTSCSQNEEFENAGQKAEINFNTAAVTRATAMVTDNFNKFKVYGYAHTGEFATVTEGKAFVEGVFSKNAEKKWIEDKGKKFYWPSEGNVTFFAYSPINEVGTTYTSPVSSTGYPTVDYTVNSAIASQSDFLVAQKTGSIADKAGISLGFKHALTQIAFKLKGSDATVDYTVRKLTLKGVKGSGTYSWETGKWIVGSEVATANYDIDMTSTPTEFAGDAAAVELTGNDKVLMLIPQNVLVDVATIEIIYTAVQSGTTICDGKVAKVVKIPAIDWGVGQRIAYTIALAPGDEINISGTVDDSSWTDKDSQPSI